MENKEQALELGDNKGGGRRTAGERLSSNEMESLVAICDTFLPSINVDGLRDADEATATFYHSSASMAGTPDLVGEIIRVKLKHPKKWLIRLGLWLLSTWIGSLILCGGKSVSTEFPYFHRFSQLSSHQREQILLSWSLSYFYLLRMFFKSIKLLTLLVFFTQVNEKKENLSWKAIGYTGPDPDHHSSTQSDEKEEASGPLYKGLVDLNNPQEKIVDDLRRFGFTISVPGKEFKLPDLAIQPSMIIKCDVVVVGSGSGGGVIAGVLANAGYKVLVLEKGKYYARRNLSLLEGHAMEEMYLSGGLLASDDLNMMVLAGSTIGGGSTINWSASIKTPPHVIKEWHDEYQLEFFDSDLYKEAINVVCEKMGVQSEIQEEGFNNEILRKGCKELGFHVENIPRNSTPDHFCGWCCFGCKDGKKLGVSETWLIDVMNSGHGAILPECEAIKVLLTRRKLVRSEKKIAIGVVFQFERKDLKQIWVAESKVIIIAGGALSTPYLLKSSGLKNPNIGKNLHLHPVTMAWGHFPDDHRHIVESTKKKSYEGGIMTAMSKVVAGFEESEYGVLIQTPALHPGMFSGLMPWISGIDIKNRMSKFSKTVHIFALARDKGSGTVKSPNSISYKMEEEDEINLKKGIEKVLRILAAAGAEEIGTHHCKGKTLNVKQASFYDFENFVKQESSRALRDLSTPICSAHQMGSCRLGVDPKTSVVKPSGETWEVEGLFVADASVLPTALGVNPMVTVQAVAYCIAQSVLDVLRRKKRE